jgi:hypothetical protein
MTSTGYRQRPAGESGPGHRFGTPQRAATFRHDSPPARPIGAAPALSPAREMLTMSRLHDTPAAPPARSPPRLGTLADWLALLMLLAGSVVWPR